MNEKTRFINQRIFYRLFRLERVKRLRSGVRDVVPVRGVVSFYLMQAIKIIAF